jgi:hypothetical protein
MATARFVLTLILIAAGCALIVASLEPIPAAVSVE